MELAIDPTADVFRNWIVGYAVRGISLYPSHDLQERTPLSVGVRNPGTEKHVVLLNPFAVKAAAIEHHPQKGESGERQRLGRRIPAPKRIAVHHVDGIRLGDSYIKVSTRNKLGSRQDRKSTR